jgi:iron(III) transport system substrate-binding protein
MKNRSFPSIILASIPMATAITFISSLLLACSSKRELEAVEVLIDDSQTDEAIVVYSSRNEHLISPVFALFTEETGINVEFTTGKAGVLIERIKAEGANTPADLLVTVDAGTLGYAVQQDIFQPLDSAEVNTRVPVYLRDDNDYWAGLSLRARTIVYSTERVQPEQLSSYQELGDKKWQGRLCLRTSKKVYNQSLVAMLIAEQGEAKTEAIVSSWVANLAIPPTSNDTKVMEAILAGQCDVGIVNTYYFGRLQTKQVDLPLALFWPNQSIDAISGVHVNVAGVGILKHSKNVPQAKRLVEWLVSDNAQALFAGVNKEYPINDGVNINPQVASWGTFKSSPLPLSQAYILQPAAVKLMDRAGYK